MGDRERRCRARHRGRAGSGVGGEARPRSAARESRGVGDAAVERASAAHLQAPDLSELSQDAACADGWGLKVKIVGIVLLAMASAAAQQYDLVISNGRVIDGTGNAWF